MEDKCYATAECEQSEVRKTTDTLVIAIKRMAVGNEGLSNNLGELQLLAGDHVPRVVLPTTLENLINIPIELPESNRVFSKRDNNVSSHQDLELPASGKPTRRK